MNGSMYFRNSVNTNQRSCFDEFKNNAKNSIDEAAADARRPDGQLKGLTDVDNGGRLQKKPVPTQSQSEDDFFANTRYSNKVLQQMQRRDLHAFPESVAAFQKDGVISHITGGDGYVRRILRIQGTYKGKEGFFEFIKEADGTINHRFFRVNR